jgi:hypothetical protein
MRLRAEQSEKHGAAGRPKGTPGNMRFDSSVEYYARMHSAWAES